MTTIVYIRRFLAEEPVYIQNPFQIKRDASIVRVARVCCPTESEGLTLHIHTLCPSPALTSARIGTRVNTEEIVAPYEAKRPPSPHVSLRQPRLYPPPPPRANG